MELNQIYRCSICGTVMEVVHGGSVPVCCGQEMEQMIENSTDAAQEKHVPVIEQTETGIIVKVGSVAHPMEQEHYIEWIEISFGDRVGRHYLKPGDAPEARFDVKDENVVARAYCNLHGLWKSS